MCIKHAEYKKAKCSCNARSVTDHGYELQWFDLINHKITMKEIILVLSDEKPQQK